MSEKRNVTISGVKLTKSEAADVRAKLNAGHDVVVLEANERRGTLIVRHPRFGERCF